MAPTFDQVRELERLGVDNVRERLRLPALVVAGWIGYLIAGFIGACILIVIARAFSGGLQQRT